MQAVSWCRKAAEQGNAIAQSNLGLQYFNGAGVEQNKEQAVFWWRKAALQGEITAQNNFNALGISWTNE